MQLIERNYQRVIAAVMLSVVLSITIRIYALLVNRDSCWNDYGLFLSLQSNTSKGSTKSGRAQRRRSSSESTRAALSQPLKIHLPPDVLCMLRMFYVL